MPRIGWPLVVGVLVVGGVVALDAAWGERRVVIAAVLLAPFITALTGSRRQAAAVALVAFAAAAVSGVWNDNFGTLDYLFRLGIVAAGGLFAALDASSRVRLAVDRQRFRLLSGAASLGDTVATADETIARLGDLLVPEFADVCVIDAGGERLVVGGAGDPEALAAIVPDARIEVELRARRQTFGTLTLARTQPGARYDGAEREFARVLGGRVALALDNAGLFSEVTELEARMTAALDSLAEAVTIQDRTGRLVYANRAAAESLGFASPDALVATPPAELTAAFTLLTEDGQPLRREELPGRRVLAGLPAPPLLVRAIDRATGAERWRLTKATAVHDDEGRPYLAVNVIEDVTETKRAELTQRILAEAGAVLAASLDAEETLAQVARLVVPSIADRCEVVLADADTDADGLAGAVLADGGARREDGPPARMVAPMIAAGQIAGVLAFTNDASSRRFGPADLELARELGRRAGIAVETSRLYTERSRIARTLQLSLLPDALPAIPGFEIASLYRPAGEETFVGGDFYDVFPTRRGWMLVVGDVTGRGAEAAALTGQARYTLRTAGTLLADPVAAIAELNHALAGRRELPICSVATVLLGEAGGATTATVAGAGHPYPLLIRDGEVHQVEAGGPLVGAWHDSRWHPVHLALEPGDVLVLYTDGVTDALGAHGRFGETRLAEAVRRAGDAPGAVERIQTALHAFEQGPQADDTAIVAVQWTPEPAGAATAASAACSAPDGD